jgi:hypothetical protein
MTDRPMPTVLILSDAERMTPDAAAAIRSSVAAGGEVDMAAVLELGVAPAVMAAVAQYVVRIAMRGTRDRLVVDLAAANERGPSATTPDDARRLAARLVDTGWVTGGPE